MHAQYRNTVNGICPHSFRNLDTSVIFIISMQDLNSTNIFYFFKYFSEIIFFPKLLKFSYCVIQNQIFIISSTGFKLEDLEIIITSKNHISEETKTKVQLFIKLDFYDTAILLLISFRVCLSINSFPSVSYVSY